MKILGSFDTTIHKTYDYGWIDFLSGNNVVEVRNEEDFNIFKNFLIKHELFGILKGLLTFKDWQKLAVVNGKPDDIFLFEYTNHKGLTWSSDRNAAIEWYGKEPLLLSEEFTETIPTHNHLIHQNIMSNLSICDIIKACDYIKALSALVPSDSQILSDKKSIITTLEEAIQKAQVEETCPRCGCQLYVSDLPQYDCVCFNCDENFF